MAHVKLFTSNTDYDSKQAYKFLYENRILARVYEWHDEKDLPTFEEYKITKVPTLIYGNHRFEGINQIYASDL